jgi:hypothetical protein
MDLEQIAILGIAVFAFMAIAHTVNSVRSMKKIVRRSRIQRVRRLISTPDSARAMALSVVHEAAQKYPDEVENLRRGTKMASELGQALEEARSYYLGRVETRHKAIFNLVVDEVIYAKKFPSTK